LAANRRPPLVGKPLYRRAELPAHSQDEILRVTEALDHLASRIEAAERRTTQAVGGADHSVSELVARLEGARRENTVIAARFEGVAEEIRAEQSRHADRLRRFEQQHPESGSTEALKTLEATVSKIAARLYEGEAETREALGALREGLTEVSGRVDAAPGDNAALVEAVVARIAERLERAEARTASAIEGLETSFGRLEDRLGAAETRLAAQEVGGGLEQIAASLSASVEAARAEMVEKIEAGADDRLDRMERTLREMTDHVQTAERRSTDALERMGHEVLRMAETLSRKVQDVERRSAEAIEHVGGEVARIADTVETRFNRADAVGAQALERLGGEIARINERLVERIANAERRSAQAIDDIGDQVASVAERLHQRQERTSTDLAERIRQSEERTARILEDARLRIEQRQHDSHSAASDPDIFAPLTEESAPEPAQPFGHRGLDPLEPAFSEHALPESTFPESTFRESDFETAAFKDAAQDEPTSMEPAPREPDLIEPALTGFATSPFNEPLSFTPAPAEAEAFEAQFLREASIAEEALAEDIFTSDGFAPKGLANEHDARAKSQEDEFQKDEALGDGPNAPVTPADTSFVAAQPRSFDPLDDADDALMEDPETAFDEPLPFGQAAAEEPASPHRPLSTRELIDQARAAARAATQASDPKARKAARTGPSGGLSFANLGLGLSKTSKRRNSSLGAALMISGGAAALSIGAASYILLAGQPSGALPTRVIAALGLPAAPARPGPKTEPAPAADPMAAVALAPQSPEDADAARIAPAASDAAAHDMAAQSGAQSGAEFYGDAVRRIEARDLSGLEPLRKAANLGYPPAQFYLAKLYETGEAGLKKDLVAARRWTERAAEAGDRKAMHNLALYYVEGSGGPKNTTNAAQWFRRAADLGLIDSQYNLGRLYEEGFGVSQNPAEAYKWYLIAAHAGDTESRASALRLKNQLSAEAQAAAERAAISFQAQSPRLATTQLAQANATGDVAGAAIAQRALSRLGYYQGPTDGSPSAALKGAIAAYQRDQGLPATGVPDTALSERLAVIAQ
jgi:localization factor PodJL